MDLRKVRANKPCSFKSFFFLQMYLYLLRKYEFPRDETDQNKPCYEFREKIVFLDHT